MERCGFYIKGKPIECLVINELSAEIRARGGKIKSNAVKDQVVQQLREMMELEKRRDKSTSKRTPPVTPPSKEIQVYNSNNNNNNSSSKPTHSSALKGKKYKNREEFYNRYKNIRKELAEASALNSSPPILSTSTAMVKRKIEESDYSDEYSDSNGYGSDTEDSSSSSSSEEEIKKPNRSTSKKPPNKRLNTSKPSLPSPTITSKTSSRSSTSSPTLSPQPSKPNYTDNNNNNSNNAIELEKKILHQYNLYPILDRVSKSNKLGYLLGKEYVRFIVLKVVEKDSIPSKLEPSPLINELWSAHILSTYKYDEFINLIQYKVHNDPDGFLDPKSKIIKRYEKTIELYKKYFNSSPDPNIWSSPL